MKILILISVLLATTFLYPTIINVPADQPTIQAGIDIAIDADTVLVQPGTYFENINYNGKNITVASLFLTTQDTTYIYQTIINGSQASYPDYGSCVKYVSGEDANSVLNGFFLTEGPGTHINYYSYGGGIYCHNSNPGLINLILSENNASIGGGICCRNNSNPYIENVTLTDNTAGETGGGICCINSNPTLINITVTNNSANIGGGIMCKENSNPSLQNVTILNNHVWAAGMVGPGFGGGIFCWDSSPTLDNVTITGNYGVNCWTYGYGSYGGGIYCDNSSPILENAVISNNSAYDGGGIDCRNNSNPSLTNVTISDNSANNNGGGGYCLSGSSLSFDPGNRCNIFFNSAGSSGCDLYSENCNTIAVIVDTFTVLQPDSYFVYPFENFTFDILNAKIEPVDQNLYVSPDGSDNNSGLSAADPLLTIYYANAKIIADSTNSHTIYLTNGNYSRSQTSERFPINCRSYISLSGENENLTILDAEELSTVVMCLNDNSFTLVNMTIQNGGNVNIGGGIYIENSSLNLVNITITDNIAASAYGATGGGIYCNNSSPNIENVTITGNVAGGRACSGGGISCVNNSCPVLVNVIISDNYSNSGGGISCWENSNPSLKNVTIAANSAYNGGGIYSSESNPSLMNCIVWNDTPEEIYFSEYNHPNSISISYSDVQGGETGIVTNNNGSVNWLEGNIDEDPLFVGAGDHPFMLQDLSPCINAGIPDTTGLNLPEFDLVGNLRVYGGRIDMGAYENQNVIVSVDESLIPNVTKLNQNYPNPFNPSTTINYSLKENSNISLNIYNIKGQKVKQLINNHQPAGKHSVVWNGKDDNGKSVSSGIYFYKMKTDNFEKTKKMIMIK